MQTDLVVRAQRGDREAFEILVTWAMPRWLAMARGVLREVDAAEDAVQRALVGMWTGLPRLRDPGAFDAWMYRLVVNACNAELRHLDPRRWSNGPEVGRQPWIGDRAEQLAERDRLERAMARISPIHRTAVMLHVALDLTQEETARILAVPLGTIHSRVARAMDALRGALAADDRQMATMLGPVDPGHPEDDLVPSSVRPLDVAPLLPPFPGRRWVVSADGFGDATSIGEAVTAAADGDVVLIRPGTYRESVTVTRSIAIVGDGPPGSVCIDVRDVASRESVRIGWASEHTVAVAVALHLVQTRSLVANLLLRGPSEAVAVLIDGGAPQLHGLDVRLDGSWHRTIGHQFALARAGATGAIVGCRANANILVMEGSSPVIEGNELSGAMTIRDPATAPVIRDNRIVVRGSAPWCLGIIRGSAPVVEGNLLTWVSGSAITVFSHETRPVIRANRIRGSRIGIQTWDQSAPTIEDNEISGNTVGVSVCWAEPDLQGNRLARNRATGLLVLGGSPPRMDGNQMVQNGRGQVRPPGMRLTGPRALQLAIDRV